jgi:hypothetical protein
LIEINDGETDDDKDTKAVERRMTAGEQVAAVYVRKKTKMT